MLKREVPLLITMVVGWFMVMEFFIPRAEPISTELQSWAIIMTALASVLGVANVARINLLKVGRRQKDWQYGVVLLFGLVLMTLLGVILPLLADIFGREQGWALGGLRLDGVTGGTLFERLYDYAFVPMQATMFSLLAFYIASAAFRAFRVRSVEAGLLAVTAVIIMIGRVPLGAHLWSGFPDLTDWIMNVPNLAAKRAILIGAALGAISTGLKVIMGIERNFLGGD